MKLWKNLKYYELFCSLLSAAGASEVEPVPHTNNTHEVQSYTSKGDWEHKVQEFLNDSKRIEKYSSFKDRYKKEYLKRQEKKWEREQRLREERGSSNVSVMSCMGTVVGALAGGLSILALGDNYFASITNVRDVGVWFAAWEIGCATVGSIVGCISSTICCSEECTVYPVVLKDCPSETVQEALKERIKKELLQNKYSENSEEFAIESRNKLLEDFVATICENSSTKDSIVELKDNVVELDEEDDVIKLDEIEIN